MAIDPSESHVDHISRNGQELVLVWSIDPPGIALARSIRDDVKKMAEVETAACRYYTKTGTFRFYITLKDMVQMFADEQLQRPEQGIIAHIHSRLYGTPPLK